MAKRLRPVTAEFLAEAPNRLVSTARLRAEPGAVFAELTDDASTWPLWFREVRSAGYTGPPPYGVGAGRAVTLRGGARFVESVVAWEEPSDGGPARFVYRVEETNVPGVRAWAEEWLLTPAAGGGTELRFTIAVDAAPAVRAVLLPARPGVARSLRRAAARLDARCGVRAD
ncbi:MULTISPECIES: SRPBCC family protein [Streptacidiphilus]|uniref:SRPBCC family protein n=2 Tax=Streptacidiphilus TaxID=228398 RepID=A0ABV6UY53_9ACTN|nr:SRPBCC family protein [Streptacidiphilus jeojiense]